MKCTSCGGSVPDNAAFCPLCGQKLAEDADPNKPAAITVGNVPEADVRPLNEEPSAAGAAAAQPAAGEQGVAATSGQGTASASAPSAQGAAATGTSEGAAPTAQAATGQPTGQPYAQQPQNPYAGAQQQNPYAGAGQPYAQQSQNPYGGAGQQPPQNPYAYGAAPQPQPQQAVYAEGCVSAALADIRATDSWLKKMLLLGLIGCVPILNFVVYGYAFNWSREVPFGGRTQMPKSIVNGKNFEIGFYAFLISLVFGLVSAIASGIVGIVPLVGWLAAVAIAFFAEMFGALCSMRMAITQQLGEGFKLGDAWNMLKRNWTSLLCAVIVPGLIAALVVAVLGLVLSLIFGLAMIAPASAAYAVGSSSTALAALVGSLGVVGVLAFVVYIVLCVGIGMMACVVSYRAVGHWVGRYAPEWVNLVSAWR